MKRLAVPEYDRASVRISTSDRSRINELRMKTGGYAHQIVTLALDALEQQLRENSESSISPSQKHRTSSEVAA